MLLRRSTIFNAKIAAATAIISFACVGAVSDADAAESAKAYIDLSHKVVSAMPVDPALKLPELEFFGRIGENGGMHNLEIISYCPHTGTHMDAPFHVIGDASSIESWPEDILIGPAAVIAIGMPGSYEITKSDITEWETENGEIKAGEAVLFHTGHDANWDLGYDAYIKNGYPTISPEAADYLVSKKIRFVAVESISPEGNSTDIHQKFLGAGIPVVENIYNLGEIGASRCETVGTFAAVDGATGVWIRLLAIK